MRGLKARQGRALLRLDAICTAILDDWNHRVLDTVHAGVRSLELRSPGVVSRGLRIASWYAVYQTFTTGNFVRFSQREVR
jgi:hypothetical protein